MERERGEKEAEQEGLLVIKVNLGVEWWRLIGVNVDKD